MTDRTTLSIGKLLDGSYERDAVHFAVYPVIATEGLAPGGALQFTDHGPPYVKGTDQFYHHPPGMPVRGQGIGIVDPFLSYPVKKGQRFWMFLYPASITALRHSWTHDQIPGTEEERERTVKRVADEILLQPHRQYLADLAKLLNVDPAELMQRADLFLHTGEHWNEGSRFEGTYLPQEFWDHYEQLRGIRVPQEERSSFFSCAC